MGKTIALFSKGDSVLLRLTGYVFVTIQDDLGSERRMPRHLNRHVSPFPVQNVKTVVLHVRFLLNQLAALPLLRAANFPHRSHGTRDQNQEQALHRRMGGELLFGDFVLPLVALTVDHGDTVRLAKACRRRLKRPAIRIR